MTNKYKLSDLAKDFNMTSKALSAIVLELTGEEKKSGATLNETEIEMVFNKLSLDNEVKSFDGYFATGDAARQKAKEDRENEKNKKLAEQMAILEQLKAAAAAQNGEKTEEKKPEPKKAEVKSEAPKKDKPKKEEPKKEEPKKEVKKEEPKKEHKPSDPNPFVSKKKDKVAGEAPKRGRTAPEPR